MLKLMEGFPDKIVAISGTGQVTGDDYESVLIPAVTEKVKTHGKIRMLYQLGPDFTGFELGAMWDDAVFGMSHMFDFEKIAVVSDVDWARNATRFFGVFLPCPVRAFPNGELAAAKSWIEA